MRAVALAATLALTSPAFAAGGAPSESSSVGEVRLYRLDQLPEVRDTMPAWVGKRPQGMFCWPPLPESGATRKLELSTEIVRLSPAAVARRVLHRRDLWAVDATWFGLGDSLDARVLGYAAVDSLGNAGAITDATLLRLATYRFTVRAKGVDEMRRAAERRIAGPVPRAVAERLEPPRASPRSRRGG